MHGPDRTSDRGGDRDLRWGQDVQPADEHEARAVPPVAPSHQQGPGSEHAARPFDPDHRPDDNEDDQAPDGPRR
jgi:hypothetical protein